MTWIVAGLAAALAAGAGAGWLAREGAVRSLEQRVAELETGRTAEESGVETETLDQTSALPPDSEPEQPPAGATPREETTGPSEVQPGRVKAVVSDAGGTRLTIDYIQFLTGAEAADAAAARGDESPPPNDYYIINDNPKLREFPIRPDIDVFVVTDADGSANPAGSTMSLDQWVAAMNGPNALAFTSQIYYVTVVNGTITSIEAQYVP